MINGFEINGAEINGTGNSLTPVGRLHSASWQMPVARLHLAPWRDSVARGFAAPYDMTAPVARLHSAPYDVTLYNKIGGADEIRLGFGAGGATDIVYDLLRPVARQHMAPFTVEQYNKIGGADEIRLGFGAGGAIDIVYNLRGTVQGSDDISLPLRTTVQGSTDIAYHLLDYNPVQGSTTIVYSLLDETPLIATGTAYLLKDGDEVSMLDDFDISVGEGEHYWQGSVTLTNAADAAAFKFADPVTLHFYGVDFALVVDSVQIDRPGGAATRATVKLVSPSALLGKPPAPQINQVWTAPESARSIVESLIGPVEWGIIDWIIPANRLGGQNAYPMDVAKRVVGAAKGLIEPNPDGSLYVRYQFPIPLSQYPVATPDHVFSEAENVFSQADSNQYFQIRDQFRITDIEDAGFSDRIEFVANEGNGLAGQLHVYPSPWRDITLRHTGPAAIAISAGADQVLEKTQQIEIIEGKGSLQYPIQAITGVAWEVVDLGGLSFEPGSTSVVSTTLGESLCTITYTTKAKVYNTSSPVEDVVQFVLYDGIES